MKEDITLVVPLGKEMRAEVAEHVSKKDALKVIVVEGANTSHNRNRGIKKARTPIVAFTNGHSILSNNWSSEVRKFFKRNPDIDIVGGPQHNSPDESSFGKASGYAMSTRFGSGGIWRRYGGTKEILDADETMLTSSNLACRKHVFKKVLFDEKIYPGEDPKFIADSKNAGFKIAYSPDIVVYNKRRTTFLALAKQVFRYGLVRPQKESLLQTAKRPFFLVPSAFILYLISLIFYHSFWYLAPLLAYLFLLIVNTIYIPIKHKKIELLPYLPFIFATIHISYGAGFLLGLLRKII